MVNKYAAPVALFDANGRALIAGRQPDAASLPVALSNEAIAAINAIVTQLVAGQAISGTVTSNQGTAGASAWPVAQTPTAAAPVEYRTAAGANAMTAADLAAAPTVGTTATEAGGSLVNSSTYNSKVVGVTAWGGRTTPTAGTARTATTGTAQTIRIPITIETGIVAWDIYLSTDSDPKFVGRITEAQRLSGILINTAATGSTPCVTGAGGAANSVDVTVPGTGAQSATTAAVNSAYIIPAGVTPVTCTNKEYVDFDVNFSLGGDQAGGQPSLTVFGVLYDADDTNYYAGDIVTWTYAGQSSGIYTPKGNVYRMQCRGRQYAQLICAAIVPNNSTQTVDVRAITS